MRLVFAGTPEFAERALASLVRAGHDVALVLTQPDRPAGRGLRPAASPVKRFAQRRGIEVFQPVTLKDAHAVKRVREARPEALVVAAYGLIVPPELLELGRGALNIHASLLPRWRGAAPIQRALLAGDRETGISIMQMDAGLDTGPVLAQARLPIGEDDDAGTLHDKLASLGAELLIAVLEDLKRGRLRSTPQPEEGVTYAQKIRREETRLDWTQPAAALERAVRAFRPAPGAWTLLQGEPIKIWRASIIDLEGQPGGLTPAEDVLIVACGEGALAVSELQRAGGRKLAAREFLRGHALAPGERVV